MRTETATRPLPLKNVLSSVPEPLDTSKYCVFRSGKTWYSVRALAVREVVVPPTRVRLPDSHPALLGVSHLRNEFVPVISLDRILGRGDVVQAVAGDERLLVFESRSAWSLLIKDSATLESLETSMARNTASTDPLLGTAMCRDRVVRVLHHDRLQACVQSALDGYWNGDRA